MIFYFLFCVSGEQAEAGPGLYEAGPAVQRTRLRDPQRVSAPSWRPHADTEARFPLFYLVLEAFQSSLLLLLDSFLKGTLTGISVDSRLWDLILTLGANTSLPNLI